MQGKYRKYFDLERDGTKYSIKTNCGLISFHFWWGNWTQFTFLLEATKIAEKHETMVFKIQDTRQGQREVPGM